MGILRYMKRADISRNRILIPKPIIDKFGREVYMDINLKDGVITLTPIKLEKKGQ